MIINKKLSRRTLLKSAGAATAAATAGVATFFGPWKHNRIYAAATDKPIKIGLTHDASGQFANSGQAERRGTIMAIDEFNAKGSVNGRKIEYVWQDTESTPSTGSRVTERMITREEVAFVVGALQSGVANAISQVCQKYGVVYLNTNSSAPTESGKNCHRVKFVWDGNGGNFALATAKAAIDTFGKRWVLLTNDYVWGHSTSKATRTYASRYGANIVDEILVPVGTRDFSTILLKVQQSKVDVVAPAVAGDDFKAMRQQVLSMGMDKKPAWSGNQIDWPDIYGLGSDAAFGVFATTWYHKLNLPGVKEFVQRYRQRWPDTRIDVPGNVTYNGYIAMRELLRVLQEVGSTNNIKVIKALEGRKLPARDRMQHHDAWIDAANHAVQQTVYLTQRNLKPSDETDYFEILNNVKPQDVITEDTNAECKLESYNNTPSYEM